MSVMRVACLPNTWRMTERTKRKLTFAGTEGIDAREHFLFKYTSFGFSDQEYLNGN